MTVLYELELSNRRIPFNILLKPVPAFNLSSRNTALLISDMQKLTVDKNGGWSKLMRLKGVSSEFEDYHAHLKRAVKNTRKILTKCRQLGIKIIFTRIVSQTKDGTDIGRQISVWDKDFPYDPDDETLSFTNEKKEIVLDKLCSNPFNCTFLEDLLKEMGIKYLIVCGVRTPGYLNSLAFDAADRDFGVIVVSDASAGGVSNGTRRLTGGLIRVRNSQATLELLEDVMKGVPE